MIKERCNKDKDSITLCANQQTHNLYESSMRLLYEKKSLTIKEKLKEFKNLPKEKYFEEFLFCMLTPQSNAKKCWKAVEQIGKFQEFNRQKLTEVLKSKTRFHNNKAGYILEAKTTWQKILPIIDQSDRIKLRNMISKNVKGYGLKEASHFLRNIGRSDNQIAILDRHILRNLNKLGIISQEEAKIKNEKNYLDIEQKFLKFSKDIKISIDELDLLFWSNENGEIFK